MMIARLNRNTTVVQVALQIVLLLAMGWAFVEPVDAAAPSLDAPTLDVLRLPPRSADVPPIFIDGCDADGGIQIGALGDFVITEEQALTRGVRCLNAPPFGP